MFSVENTAATVDDFGCLAVAHPTDLSEPDERFERFSCMAGTT
jgi:hypothetical protein